MRSRLHPMSFPEMSRMMLIMAFSMTATLLPPASMFPMHILTAILRLSAVFAQSRVGMVCFPHFDAQNVCSTNLVFCSKMLRCDNFNAAAEAHELWQLLEQQQHQASPDPSRTNTKRRTGELLAILGLSFKKCLTVDCLARAPALRDLGPFCWLFEARPHATGRPTKPASSRPWSFLLTTTEKSCFFSSREKLAR